MRIRNTIVIALLGLLIGFAGLGAARQNPSGSAARISASDLAAELAEPGQQLVIVDVREPELYNAGHIPGAINLPYPGAKTEALAALEPDQRIVFVCHGGPMGDELLRILTRNGYAQVRNLRGGMDDWSGPLERGP